MIPASTPTVSVIIPTHNRAHLLPRALDSVLSQGFADLEVLVVDDGSTDGTAELMKRYDDPRVRYLVQPQNQGVSAARNRGMREARGRFLALLDSDDEWMPDKLAAQVVFLEDADAKVGAVYTGVETIDPNGERHAHLPQHRGDLFDVLLVRNVLHGAPSNILMRREVIDEVGFFDEAIPAIEDYDYFLRLAKRYHIEMIDRPLARYYDAWVSDRKSLNLRENFEARNYFYRKHRVDLERAGVAEAFWRETQVRYALNARQEARRTLRRRPLAVGSYLRVFESFAISLACLARRGRRRWGWAQRRVGKVESTASERVQHEHAA